MVHKAVAILASVALMFLSMGSVEGRPTSVHARALKLSKGAVKGSACADKKGYITMSNINWSGAKDSSAISVDIAETTCNKNPNCVAFNTYSYYAVSEPSGYYPLAGLCTYIKNNGKTVSASTCEEHAGYTTLSNTNWEGAKDSQMENSSDANDACDGDDNCKLFNSFAYYTLGDASDYYPYEGLCSYVKDSAV